MTADEWIKVWERSSYVYAETEHGDHPHSLISQARFQLANAYLTRAAIELTERGWRYSCFTDRWAPPK